MKKQDVKKTKKVELDLDAALEEVARKLRPNAARSETVDHTGLDSCCVSSDTQCCSRGY